MGLKAKNNISFARSAAILGAVALMAVVALSSVFAPRQAAAANATLCATYADLNAALTNAATTSIVLTANITLTNGIQINTAMANGLVIDGKDPVTGQIHTITEVNSQVQSNTLYVNSTGTLKTLTVQNLNIVGYNQYGFVGVNDSVHGFDLVYKNVTYNGPQMTFNRYGSVEYDDCSITIGPAGNSQECAQVATVILGGTTTITSATTSDAVFWPEQNYNNTTPGSFQVKPGAVVKITSATSSSRGLFYLSVSNMDFIVGSGASFTYQGNNWNTQSTDFANITIADGTATQPTTVNIIEPYTLATASTDLLRATNIKIGNYCNVNVSGLPGSTFNAIYAGNALTVGDNSTVQATVNTANGTGNFAGNAIYVANAASSTGITVGANSRVAATINGNNTGNTGAIATASTGANSGIHLNGPGSTMELDITGSNSTYGYYIPGGSVYIGPNCAMSVVYSGGASDWGVYASFTAGTFKLDQGASLLIDDAKLSATSTNGGLYVAATTGVQMADSSSLTVLVSGYNQTSTTGGLGNMVYLPSGSLTTGQNCDIQVKTIGTNTALYAGISCRGVSLGTGTTMNVDLNANTSNFGVYSNGAFTVGQNANLMIHTAANVTTRQDLLYLVAGAFTANQGSTVQIIAQDKVASAAYASVFANAAGMTFNSPKSVVIYNYSGGTLVQYGATGFFTVNNVQQLGLWHVVDSWPAAMTSGRFDPLPTYDWRYGADPNSGLVGATNISGTVPSGTYAALNNLTAPGVVNFPALASDQGSGPPTTTTLFMGSNGTLRTYAMAFGYLPLTASTDNAVNPGSVSGTTDPGSSVVLAVQNGNQYVPVGTPAVADANGNYAIDLRNTGVAANTSYAVISSNPTNFMTTKIDVTFRHVTFDANGGQNDPSVPVPLAVVDGATIAAPPAPTNGMKSFGGWFTDPALTQPFAFDTTPITADITLYAKWSSTSVIIRESVLGVSGTLATPGDYALAGLSPARNVVFELVFTSQQTGAVYNVLAYRDRPVTLDSLPGGQTYLVSARPVQHMAADSIVVVSASNGAIFVAQSPTTGVLSLGAESSIELNFINRIAPAGFGDMESLFNYYKLE